jgi:endonuclease/exonuclease/phosphatase family metal-dependent hydrolase
LEGHRLRLLVALIAACCTASACGQSPTQPSKGGNSPPGTGPQAPPPAAGSSLTFKVATWNIRSGMGIRGFTTTTWSSDTLNCTDPSKPLNAWGIRLPQTELGRIRDDPAIVAFAVQEAWNCGNPANINGELGFQAMSREQNGTALAARYGFATAPTYTKVSNEDWVVGGRVCLNAACSTTLPIFAAHWSSATDDYGPMAQSTLDLLRSQPTPLVLMGDLNVYRVDAWNPKVRCTGDDVAGRVDAIRRMEAAGYIDAWKTTQSGEGWTGMASRAGCGEPSGNLFKRIDYVYTIGNLTARSATRIARAAPGADAPSDHVALVVELSLAQSSGR